MSARLLNRPVLKSDLFRNCFRTGLIGLFLFFCTGCTVTGGKETASDLDLPDSIEIYFFYDEICGSCEEEFSIFEVFHEMAGDVAELHPYRLISQNVAKTSGRSVFEEAMASFGHSVENVNFPLMMVGSRLFHGEENIRQNIREAFLVAGEDIFVNKYVFNLINSPVSPAELFQIKADKNTIVYFYRIVCPACMEVEPFLDTLPEHVTVDGENVPINIVRINTRSGDNGALIRKFFTHYDVPDHDQLVPIVFLRDRYLAGDEDIMSELPNLLAQGAGLDFDITVFGGD